MLSSDSPVRRPTYCHSECILFEPMVRSYGLSKFGYSLYLAKTADRQYTGLRKKLPSPLGPVKADPALISVNLECNGLGALLC